MKRSGNSRKLYQLTPEECATSLSGRAAKGYPVTNWEELIGFVLETGDSIVIPPVTRRKQSANPERTNLKRHERLLEEARLITQFDRYFGYPPPGSSEQPVFISLLKIAIETGEAPEEWKPTHGRLSESCMKLDELDEEEGV